MTFSNRDRSHRRLAGFVDWIKPDPKMRESIRKQAENIRDVIRSQARADGLVITATPNGGSFPTRRYARTSRVPLLRELRQLRTEALID
jgi:hypothetical protein